MENQPDGQAAAPEPASKPDFSRKPTRDPIRNPERPAAQAENGSKARGLWMLGLAVLAFAVRSPGLFAGFVFDDAFGIEQRVAASWSHVPGFFTSDQSALFGSNFYRPILDCWCELTYALCGAHAAGWHLVSILLHVAATLLVFRLALRVFGLPVKTEPQVAESRAPGSLLAAGLAAALFAVHPAHTEAISWASAMADPLWTLLMLASVLCFLRWMEQPGMDHSGPLWWAASFLAGSAAVFTKETAVVLPVVLLATALFLRPGADDSEAASHSEAGFRARLGVPMLAVATVPFFALSLIFLQLRQSVLHSFSHSLTVATTAQMLYTWPAALLFYLRHMIWPGVVVPFYPLQIVQSLNLREFFLPLLALAAISGVLLYLLYRAAGWRRLALCVAWTLTPLAAPLYLKALAPFELVHDRFLYAPLVGFCLAAALILQWLSDRVQATTQFRILPLFAIALIPLLGFDSMSQALWWQNNKTLFTRAVAVTPDNPKALVSLATAWMADRHYRESLPLLQRALELDPRNANALFALGRIGWEMGDDAGAARYLAAALSIQPRYDMWLHLASVDLHLNRLDDAEAAVHRAEAMNPAGAGVHIAMGAVLLAKGNHAGAADEFREELKTYPQSEPARAGLAQAAGISPR